jgi:hypothetical protein
MVDVPTSVDEVLRPFIGLSLRRGPKCPTRDAFATMVGQKWHPISYVKLERGTGKVDPDIVLVDDRFIRVLIDNDDQIFGFLVPK